MLKIRAYNSVVAAKISSVVLLCSFALHGAEVASSQPRSFDLDTTSRVPPTNGTIFDFESEEERSAVPFIDNASCHVCVTNRYASSGEHAVAFVCADWRPGMNLWPSFTMNTKTSDWTGYDRLAVDVVNIGEGCGTFLGIILGGPEGKIQRGKKVTTRIPENGFVQWVIPLEKMPKSVSLDCVTRIHFFTDTPSGFAVALDRITLLKPGEEPPVPDGPHVGRDLWPRLVAKQREMQQRLHEGDGHAMDVLRFRRACIENGVQSPAMLLGKATSMEKILPRGRFSVEPLTDEGLYIRLAGNEYESGQLLVMPKGGDLRHVRVAVDGDLECKAQNDGRGKSSFAATNIMCAVMGYVCVSNPPPYWAGYNLPSADAVGYVRKTRPAELGWWPDPILDFLDAADVSGTDLQSFWIRIHCPDGQPAGVYGGSVIVTADGSEPVRIPLTVRVNGFSVGRTSELPLAVTFDPKATIKGVDALPNSPVKLWKRHKAKWVDFLADYLIPFDSLYDWGDPERLFAQRRLGAEGRTGLMNLGYWSTPAKTDEKSMNNFRNGTVKRLKGSYSRAKAAGQAKFYVYGCDEATDERFPMIRAGALEIKNAMPDVPLFTTAYDYNFGVGTLLDVIDWFSPLTSAYDPEKSAVSRRAGHQVWWYICLSPPSPYANMFIESSAIEGRLLMGAQTQRMKPDGFLYYQISIWNAASAIMSGPYTDWPVLTYENYHGDGQWTCVGPDGIPLPTIRLENFRDGLEDYAYAKLLEEKLRIRGTGNGERGTDEWIRRARAAIAVPREVMDTMTNYTDDPAVLYRWRDAMADLIEEAQRLHPTSTTNPQRKEQEK